MVAKSLNIPDLGIMGGALKIKDMILQPSVLQLSEMAVELAVGSSEMGVLAPATWPFAMEMLPCIRSRCHLQHYQFLPMSTCHSRMNNRMNLW